MNTLLTSPLADGRHGGPCLYKACSACAGDYEDPERTAWDGELQDEEEELTPGERERPRIPAREFPVEPEETGKHV